MKKKLISVVTLLLIFSLGCAFNLAHAKNINTLQAAKKSTVKTINKDWQVISRLGYVSGSIISCRSSTADGPVIKIRVETCYHTSTDPVTGIDYPFKTGQEESFLLIEHPEVDLHTGQKVVLYEGQFASKGKSDFLGARVKYYEKGGRFLDMNGKEVNLPPQDYPDKL